MYSCCLIKEIKGLKELHENFLAVFVYKISSKIVCIQIVAIQIPTKLKSQINNVALKLISPGQTETKKCNCCVVKCCLKF